MTCGGGDQLNAGKGKERIVDDDDDVEGADEKEDARKSETNKTIGQKRATSGAYAKVVPFSVRFLPPTFGTDQAMPSVFVHNS